MLGKRRQVGATGLCDGHVKGGQRVDGPQAFEKCPIYDFVRERVGDDMQVGHTRVGVDVGYICDS